MHVLQFILINVQLVRLAEYWFSLYQLMADDMIMIKLNILLWE